MIFLTRRHLGLVDSTVERRLPRWSNSTLTPFGARAGASLRRASSSPETDPNLAMSAARPDDVTA